MTTLRTAARETIVLPIYYEINLVKFNSLSRTTVRRGVGMAD